MVNFRPHIAKVSVIGSNAIYNQQTGEYDVINGNTIVEFMCRLSPNSGGSLIPSKDGNSIVFSYILHADVNVPNLIVGSDIEVSNGTELIVKSKILSYYKYQMGVKIHI